MSLLMICPKCAGRWVALSYSGRILGNHQSYDYRLTALYCPRCGTNGQINDLAVLEYQQHPDTVATTMTT